MYKLLLRFSEQKAEAMEEDVASDSLMEMIQALEENGRLGIYANRA